MTNQGLAVDYTITISARFVARLLASAILFLLIMHTGVHVAHFGFGHDHLMGLTELFDMNRENNVPTWYSGTAMLCTAAALGVVAFAKVQAGDPFRRHWVVLALLFVYLSLDELTHIHENWGDALNAPLAQLRNRDVLGGSLRNLWVLPAIVVAGVVGLFFLRFLLHLPARTRALFFVSGVTFVFAAVGMEMVGASFSAAGLREAPQFMVLATIEETLEMSSIALFFYAVLLYAAAIPGGVQVRIRT